MTFYDDAEFAAIKMVRISLTEDDGQPRSAEMQEVAVDMFNRHGSDGVAALSIALARQYSAALHVVAAGRDTSASDVLDGFEQHKLEQIQHESDRPDDV